MLGYVVLGLFNQLAELAILANGDSGGPFPAVLALTGPVRGLLLPLFLVPVAVALLQMHRDRTSGTGPPPEPVWRGAPTAYRVLFVVVILHAVLVLVSIPGEQSADALRLWLTNPLLGVTGLVFTALFCVALAAIALRIGTDANPKRVVLARAGTARLIGIGFALGVVGGVARYGFDQAWGAGVLAAGILVLLAGLLSFPLAPAAAGDPPTTATTDSEPGGRRAGDLGEAPGAGPPGRRPVHGAGRQPRTGRDPDDPGRELERLAGRGRRDRRRLRRHRVVPRPTGGAVGVQGGHGHPAPGLPGHGLGAHRGHRRRVRGRRLRRSAAVVP